ncbi:MAG: hypothetical protein AAF713_14380 [Pseudomonadota bacterium]
MTFFSWTDRQPLRVAFSRRGGGDVSLFVTPEPDAVQLGGGTAPIELPAATNMEAGVMSAADKLKLDNIASGSFASVAQLQASTIEAGVDFVRTAGYGAPGDRGAALYARSALEPLHGGKVQSADGNWWALAEQTVTPQMFGATGDGAQDDAAAIKAACDFGVATTAKVYIPQTESGYRLGSGGHTIILSRDLTIESNGAELIVDHGAATTFSFEAEAVATPSYQGSTTRGEDEITVDSIAGISPDDLIAIDSTKVWENAWFYVQREAHVVKEVSGSTVSLGDPTVFTYAAASDGVTLTVRKPVALSVQGKLGIVYPLTQAGGPRVIDLIYLTGATLEGLSLIDRHRRMGSGPDPLFANWCIDTTIKDAFLEGCRYPINISGGSRNTRIENINSQFCWHPIDFNFGAHGGLVRNLTGRQNHATVNAHASFDIAYEKVRCTNAEGANLRSCGGRITDFRFVSTKSLGTNSMIWQSISFISEYAAGSTTDMAQDFDFVVDGVVMKCPNATNIAGCSLWAGSNLRSMTVRDSQFAGLLNGTYTPDMIVTVEGSILQFIRHRGKKLTVNGGRIMKAHASIPASLHGAANAAYEGVFGQDVSFNHCTIEGHDYVCQPGHTTSWRYTGALFENIALDFFTPDGTDSADVIAFLTAVTYRNCTMPGTNTLNRTVIVNGARQTLGSGVDASFL